MPVQRIVGPVPGLAERLAGVVEDAAREARLEGRPVSLAVPGGSVAESFFPRLASLDLDWDRVLVFFGDERAVAPDDPASNARLARDLWLDRAPIPLANVHRMRAEGEDLDAAARAYERVLLDVLGDPPRLDLALLGMGPDGHVCSLFPGHPALDETERYVLPVLDAPKPPPRRVTLTLLALARARTVVLAAFGAAKAEAVRSALDDPASTLPAARALRGAARAFALLDPAAARVK
jgi:6-phosphogluconolactonase